MDLKAQVKQWTNQNPIRVWRKANGYTLHQAAALVGVSLGAIQFWEMGQNRPTEENMAALNRLMGITASDFDQWIESRPRI